MNMRALQRIGWSVLSLLCVLVFVPSYATAEEPKNALKLTVIPAKTILSPALIKKPISFSASGFSPGELVVVELLLPKGMKMKGISESENRVGIALGNADENGDLKTAMSPIATLNWFFQVGWTPLVTPDFKKARPLPAGTYKIMASGMVTDQVAMATLEFLPPPKKK